MKWEDIDSDLINFVQESSKTLRVIPPMPQEEEMKRVRRDLEAAFAQPLPNSPQLDVRQDVSGNEEVAKAEARIGPRNPDHPLVKKETGGRFPPST